MLLTYLSVEVTIKYILEPITITTEKVWGNYFVGVAKEK